MSLMKKYADELPEAPLRIVRRLREAGHQAYFVGGAPRDMLLGERPKDYDVATSASPEEIARLFPDRLEIGAHFGIFAIVWDGIKTEIGIFRSDGAYLDGRRPERVSFGSAREDALRRDFSINGLFYDPIEDRILDYVGGREDLERRILRAIGDPTQRFEEDALRLARAARFALRFGLAIEPRTRKAIVENAGRLALVSAERIRDELIGIFTGPDPGGGLALLSELGLLKIVLPEVEAMHGVEQPAQFHPEGDVFEHTVECMRKLPPAPSLTLAFGMLLHDVGKPPTFERLDRIRFNNHARMGALLCDAICQRLRFSNRERECIVGLVRDHMRFMDVQRMKRSTLRRFLAKPGFEEDLALHRADCLASKGALDNWGFCLAALAELRESRQAPAPPPLLNGRDLIALGLKPGPAFKMLLSQIYDAQLDGSIETREAALDLARHLAKDCSRADVGR
ncbi:MAG: CCA-adding enzyme [candidate division BRC1 bacterium ADurb.BinA364]|nr:MAG: CCA-adding enzyme [candidate division BRC1 bacterium ADurb.BinA364]